eukprot:6063079-Heterocapsa_arctica.AAC.1
MFWRPTEVPCGRGALSVCPFGGLLGAQEQPISSWRGVPQGPPRGPSQRAPLTKGTSVGHRKGRFSGF